MCLLVALPITHGQLSRAESHLLIWACGGPSNAVGCGGRGGLAQLLAGGCPADDGVTACAPTGDRTLRCYLLSRGQQGRAGQGTAGQLVRRTKEGSSSSGSWLPGSRHALD